VGRDSVQHSIRINDQYRLCFRWENGYADEVEIVDYHQALAGSTADRPTSASRTAADAPRGNAAGGVPEASFNLVGLRRAVGRVVPSAQRDHQGQARVTADTGLRLARVTGMSADFWLGLQQDWDLSHAVRSKAASVIAKLEPLPRAG